MPFRNLPELTLMHSLDHKGIIHHDFSHRIIAAVPEDVFVGDARSSMGQEYGSLNM